MDTKTIIVTLVCAVLGSSALTAVVNAVVGAIQKKRGKATTQEERLTEINKKLGKIDDRAFCQPVYAASRVHAGNARSEDKFRDIET